MTSVTQYDDAGTPTTSNLGTAASQYRSLGEWITVLASLSPAVVRGPSFDVALSFAPYQTLSRGKRSAAQVFWSVYHLPVELSDQSLLGNNGYYVNNFQSDMTDISNSNKALAIPQFRTFNDDVIPKFIADVKNPGFQILAFLGHALPGPQGGPYANLAVGVCFLYPGNPQQTGYYFDCLARSGFYEDPLSWPYDQTTGLTTSVSVHVDKLPISARITFVGSCDWNNEFQQLWSPGNSDQIIVVPVQNTAHPEVDLAVAAQFWRELMTHLAAGDTIGTATEKANQFVLTIPNPPPPNSPPGTQGNPPYRWEQWTVVGNSGMKLPN